MSYHVIALVDEGKPTWTTVPLSTHETLAGCMADYRRQQQVYRKGGFDTDVKGITVQHDKDSGEATDAQAVAHESDVRPTRGRSTR